MVLGTLWQGISWGPQDLCLLSSFPARRGKGVAHCFGCFAFPVTVGDIWVAVS